MEWKDVEGYSGLYRVSNLGEIRSLDRYVSCKNGSLKFFKGCLLAKRIDTKGYYRINLSKKGTQKTYRVHRLVAEAFIPRKVGKEYINHIDGNKLNNNVDNLEWVTREENVTHATNNGLMARGEKSGNSKLSKEDVLCIKKLLKEKSFNVKELSKKFNVCVDTIYRIKHDKIWKHIKI